jgi:DNA-nicking Smr family endonuclease
MTRRRRGPTEEELELWRKVTETIAPLEEQRPPPKKDAPAESLPPAAAKKAPPLPPAPMLKVRKPPVPKPPPGLAPMDRRARSRVSRGIVAVDRRVDLHGLTQAAAERRLDRFLRDAQAEGARVVLVITGKGKQASETGGAERGVLRRMVPLWLSAPGLRSVVVGFEEAAPNHGGAGALYVRIRRQR